MPEFVRLRCGAFRIALADDDERGRFHIFNEAYGRTFLINRWIVVHGSAEERDHPLTNQVLTIVTLPIRNAGTRDSSAETICLRDSPHGHEPAVTPAHHAETVGINWIFLYRSVGPGKIVAQIAASEILHVRTGEVLTLAITAAWIGKQRVITAVGKRSDDRARHSKRCRPL